MMVSILQVFQSVELLSCGSIGRRGVFCFSFHSPIAFHSNRAKVNLQALPIDLESEELL